MSEKPGVIIYFDILGTVERLSNEDAGILFRAMLQYGLEKTIPDLSGVLYVLWPMVQMRLDSDDQRYYDVSQKRKYAAYCRWAKKRNETPLEYDEWLCSLDREIDHYPIDDLDAFA